MTDELVEVTITAPDAAWLEDLCHQLVDARPAASAHVIHPVTSIYRWQDSVHQSTEARAFLRSPARSHRRHRRLRPRAPPLRGPERDRRAAHRRQPALPGLGADRNGRCRLLALRVTRAPR